MDDIDASNMNIVMARQVNAVHLNTVLGIEKDHLRRNKSGPDHLLSMIDIVKKGIEGSNPLSKTRSEAAPLVRGKDAGNNVKRDEALSPRGLPVYREGNTQPAKKAFGLFPPSFHLRRWTGVQPILKNAVVSADPAIRQIHFVDWTHRRALHPGGNSQGTNDRRRNHRLFGFHLRPSYSLPNHCPTASTGGTEPWKRPLMRLSMRC